MDHSNTCCGNRVKQSISAWSRSKGQVLKWCVQNYFDQRPWPWLVCLVPRPSTRLIHDYSIYGSDHPLCQLLLLECTITSYYWFTLIFPLPPSLPFLPPTSFFPPVFSCPSHTVIFKAKQMAILLLNNWHCLGEEIKAHHSYHSVRPDNEV